MLVKLHLNKYSKTILWLGLGTILLFVSSFFIWQYYLYSVSPVKALVSQSKPDTTGIPVVQKEKCPVGYSLNVSLVPTLQQGIIHNKYCRPWLYQLFFRIGL